MKKTTNNISYFHKHTNKKYTVFQNTKLQLLFNTLLALTILFTLFSWKGKTEITIETTNKSGIYLLKFEIESIYIERKESSMHKKIQKHRHRQESKSNDK
jgi:hypothetical protein